MSDYVKSTNFYVKDSLLIGNPDKIVKGSELDTEFNNIATAVASKGNYASPNFTGIPTAPTAPAGTNTSQIATCAFVLQNSVPIGAIFIWSGSIATIPSGYSLCDGTNGTPNLRDKFVIGAGNLYNPATSGGSKDAIIPAHTHTTTLTDPGHTHQQVNNGADVDTGSYTAYDHTSGTYYTNGSTADSTAYTKSATTGITINVASAGVDATDGNLPPYYALAYIMRVSY